MPESMFIEDMHIETKSEDFLRYIFCTLPVVPAYVELRALAKGIPDYDHDKKGINKHISQCKKNDTIPFSKTEFIYDSRTDRFVPGSINLENFISRIQYDDEKLYQKMIDSITDRQLAGGKPHKLQIETGIPAEKGFALFKKTLFDNIQNNGYDIDWCEIWLTSRYSKQHYDEGHSGVSTIKLSREDQKMSLDMNLKKDEPESFINSMISWFANSKDLYKNID